MPILTNVSLQFSGGLEYLEDALRQMQGIANLWTISIWMKPSETPSLFDSDSNPLFNPDGKALFHVKGADHRSEVLIWGDRIEDRVIEEFVVVENWDKDNRRISVTRFNMAQKKDEWRNFSCVWNGSNLIAWSDGQELTDFSGTFSGIGSAIMEDSSEANKFRSVRVAAAYSGISTPSSDVPHIVSYSGLLGPIAVWNSVLSETEINLNVDAGFGMDLTTNSGSYTSSANLQHWWRLGADVDDVGADYSGSVNVGDDGTITGTNVVTDSP